MWLGRTDTGTEPLGPLSTQLHIEKGGEAGTDGERTGTEPGQTVGVAADGAQLWDWRKIA